MRISDKHLLDELAPVDLNLGDAVVQGCRVFVCGFEHINTWSLLITLSIGVVVAEIKFEPVGLSLISCGVHDTHHNKGDCELGARLHIEGDVLVCDG